MSGPADEYADLTPIQRKVLRNYRDFLVTPPTFSSLLAKNLDRLLLILFYLGGVVAGCAVLDQAEWSLFFAGFAVGLMLQLLSTFRVFLRVWPAVAAVIDRDRLEALVDEPAPEATRDEWS